MQKLMLSCGVLLGCLLLFGGVWEARRLTQEEKWPIVSGIVKDAKLFEADRSSWIEVHYRYEVNGKPYIDDSTVDTVKRRSVPRGYQEGATVELHYDVTRPDHTYLEHPGYESPIALTIFGGVVLLICLPFVAIHWQHAKSVAIHRS